MRVVGTFLAIAMAACGTTTAGVDAGSLDASLDAGDASDVAIPPCWQADAGPPPDATASELAGVGVCCGSTSDCTLSTAICVSGRCCIPVHDTGRRCHANSDCCSLQCSCGDACDPSSAGGGECAPYP